MTEQDDVERSKPAQRANAADAVEVAGLADVADVDSLYEQALRGITALDAEWARALQDLARAGPTAPDRG